MLFFASFSTGLAALLVGFLVLITLVGVYSVLVWPLTYWDLTNLGLEKYAGWTATAVVSLFAGGAVAGFWMFSGERFTTQKARVPARNTRSQRQQGT